MIFIAREYKHQAYILVKKKVWLITKDRHLKLVTLVIFMYGKLQESGFSEIIPEIHM